MYERARPDYPAEALDWIVETLELRPGAHVVDVGAGTGKFARQLAARGIRVTAVEPVREMREILARTLPEVAAIDGTAESIPLADEAADAVTAAQAFHWFDVDRALPELARVLRPRGGLALIWNVRDEQDELQRAYADLLRPHRGDDYPSYRGTEPFPETPVFEHHERRAFRHEQQLDADGLVERAASVSFVAQLPDGERERLLAQIRALAPAGTFAFPYVARVFVCRKRSTSSANTTTSSTLRATSDHTA